MKKVLWIFVLFVGCDQPRKPGTQEDLERNVAWQIQNRNEYRREGAEERRNKMQDQARTEAQQSNAWRVMDESLGLHEQVAMLHKLERIEKSLPRIEKQIVQGSVYGEDTKLTDVAKSLKDGQTVLITREFLREIIQELKK